MIFGSLLSAFQLAPNSQQYRIMPSIATSALLLLVCGLCLASAHRSNHVEDVEGVVGELQGQTGISLLSRLHWPDPEQLTRNLPSFSAFPTYNALDDWEQTVDMMRKAWGWFGGKLVRKPDYNENLARVESEREHTNLIYTARRSADQEAKRCLNGGFEGNVTNAPVNKCEGQKCIITELNCNGVIHTPWDYSGPFSQCTVTKMYCENSAAEEFTKPPRENCVIDKLLCENELKHPDDVTNITMCDAQIRCGNLFFGFEAFDFYCETEKLFCNGSVIEDPSDLPVSTDCVIKKAPCESIGPKGTFTKITTKCSESIIDRLCPNVIDHKIPCESNRPKEFCRLDMIDCGGVTYNASQYNGSLLFCENVRSVKCSDRVIQVNPRADELFNTYYCRVVELDCNGTITIFFDKIPSTCSISKIICADITSIANCTTHVFGCSKPNCTYQVNTAPTSSNCTQPGTVVGCICPVDFTGKRCQQQVPVDCNFTLIEPTPDCEPYDDFYLNDPVCYRYNTKDVIKIALNATCGLRRVNYDRNKIGPFNYTLVTDKLALSAPPSSLVVLKVTNFRRLSDYNASIITELPRNVIAEKEPLILHLNVSTLHSDYITGGRIYATLVMSYAFGVVADVSAPKLATLVFDIMDWEDPVPRRHNIYVGAIVAAVALPLGVLAIGGIVVWYVLRKRKEKRQEEEEEKEWLLDNVDKQNE